MALTSYLGMEYPNENLDPYWSTIRSFFLTLDAWIYAALENRDLLMSGGADLALVGDVLSWTDPIYLKSMRSGGVITIAAGSLTIADGQCAVVTVGSRPIGNQTLVPAAAVNVTTRNQIPFLYRNGTEVISMAGGGSGGRVLDSHVFYDPVDYATNQTIEGAHGKTIFNTGAAGDVEYILSATGFSAGDRFWVWRVNKKEVRIYADPATANQLFFEDVEIGGSDVQGVLLNSRGACVEFIVASVVGGAATFVGKVLHGNVRVLCEDSLGAEVKGPAWRPSQSHAKTANLVALPENIMTARGAGAGAAGYWTPRVLHGENMLGIDALNSFSNGSTSDYELVTFNILSAYTGGTQGFVVAGDQTAFFNVGRRFAVRGAPFNNTEDAEYLTRSASYAAGPDETTIEIEDGSGLGYIMDTVAASVAGGSIYTSIIRILRAGRFRIRAEARGFGCGYTALRIVTNPHIYQTYDADDGHVTANGSPLAACERIDGYAGMGMDAATETRIMVEAFQPGPYPSGSDPAYIEVQQFVEAEYVGPGNGAGAGWCSWGYPWLAANATEFNQAGDLPVWMSVKIIEANS